jgi:hypothetical protein
MDLLADTLFSTPSAAEVRDAARRLDFRSLLQESVELMLLGMREVCVVPYASYTRGWVAVRRVSREHGGYVWRCRFVPAMLSAKLVIAITDAFSRL